MYVFNSNSMVNNYIPKLSLSEDGQLDYITKYIDFYGILLFLLK